VTHEQAELFERFAGIWAEIYRQYHNLRSTEDIPLDIAVAVGNDAGVREKVRMGRAGEAGIQRGVSEEVGT